MGPGGWGSPGLLRRSNLLVNIIAGIGGQGRAEILYYRAFTAVYYVSLSSLSGHGREAILCATKCATYGVPVYSVRKLTQEQVKVAIAKGGLVKDGKLKTKISDGENLYLSIKGGRGYFTHQFRDNDGKLRNHSIGPASGDDAITLAAARRQRADFMARKRAGAPLAIRERKATGDTFGASLQSYLDSHPKVSAATVSLSARFIPTDFKAKSVHAITAEDVAAVLRGKDEKGETIWTGPGPNRGNRLRLLMCYVFASKSVRPNPAEWQSEGAALPHLLDDERKAATHPPSMPHAELPAFAATLDDSIEDRAGKFVILTAARRKEALAAAWSEFDLAKRVWTIPAARMKMGREHRVPLTDAMIACLGKPGAANEFVFQNATGGPLSNSHAALDKTWLPNGYTLHGFRATFGTWAEEQDDGRAFPPTVIEAALAHVKGAKHEAAYRRSQLVEARRPLMEAWSKFATGTA